MMMMMKIKTNELHGAALDWAVAKCEGVAHESFMLAMDYMAWRARQFDDPDELTGPHHAYQYSSQWACGGPIIERENIYLCGKRWKGGTWVGVINCPSGGMPIASKQGDTALTAAMRCYVAYKLGDEVDVPEELT